MQSNLEKIREKCIEANPSIMELKFGCETDYGVITGIDGVRLKLDCTERYVSKGQVERGVAKIIGRPIRLADVLLAVDEIESGYSIGTDGRFQYLDVDGNLEWCTKPYAVSWNLKDNNLENQSEETLQFIADLL